MKTTHLKLSQRHGAAILFIASTFALASFPLAAQTAVHHFSVASTGTKGGGYTFSGTCDEGHKVSINGKTSADPVSQKRITIHVEFICNAANLPPSVTFTKTGTTNVFKFNINTVFSASAPATVAAPQLAEGYWDFEPKQFLSKTIEPNVDVVAPRFQLTL